MPNRDRTGPEGKGPGTGRGLGPCTDGTTEKQLEDRRVRGLGRGRGAPKGGGQGKARGRRKGPNGVTYFT